MYPIANAASVAAWNPAAPPQSYQNTFSEDPKPNLYIAVFLIWGACWLWFHPRLVQLLYMADGPLEWATLVFFILFIEFAWLYGIYNLTLVGFAVSYRLFYRKEERALPALLSQSAPPVAILYTTCNDFVGASAKSCVLQDYPHFKVYILDDSSSEVHREKVDLFAAQYPEKVIVVRRPNRVAYKAGNMNHGLENVAISEPYFAIADADEILPPDFLSKLVPILESDKNCGFVQANHRANPNAESRLARDQGVGIDLHWKWYQPLRNRYGFVMFLGHGALIRRSCWKEIGGFPDIVSEDLGFAIRVRELGYRGRFVEDVVCYEDFPDTVRSFRIRHMKWTRGTCEFLMKETGRLLRAKCITWQEKLDILFPTLNLPLTLLYFVFMLVANLAIPAMFGQERIITWENGEQVFKFPIIGLEKGFEVIFHADFYLITLLTFFAPVLCFIIGLAHKPLQLFRFLCHSTSLYAALGPLSAVGIFTFLFSRKAVFLVTGDKQKSSSQKTTSSFSKRMRRSWKDLMNKSHPDHLAIQGFEVLVGLSLAVLCVYLFQISFLGLCLAFIFLPLMHHLGWKHPVMRVAVFLPFILILSGLSLGAMSAFGVATVFFGYGFHF
jgi:cellulose synthase/poly-beta-1,6-N-acetylglucosamine synthase-like glycosyltransferase